MRKEQHWLQFSFLKLYKKKLRQRKEKTKLKSELLNVNNRLYPAPLLGWFVYQQDTIIFFFDDPYFC